VFRYKKVFFTQKYIGQNQLKFNDIFFVSRQSFALLSKLKIDIFVLFCWAANNFNEITENLEVFLAIF